MRIDTKQQIERPLIQGYTESSELSSKEIRQLLFGLSQKSNYSLAEIMVDEEEFSRLNDGKMSDKSEIQVISMACHSLKSLQKVTPLV